MSEAEECSRLVDVRAFWDGELRGEAVEELTRHLGQCRICRDEHREIERFMALLEAGDAAELLAEARREELRAAVLAACGPERPAGGWLTVLLGSRQRDERRLLRVRRRAWVLVPIAAVLLLGWFARLPRPAEPEAAVVRATPSGSDRRDAPQPQVRRQPDTGTPHKKTNDESAPPLPKGEPGPAIVKGREPASGPVQQRRRIRLRVAQASPLRKTPRAAEAAAPGSPERPPQKVRVAPQRPSPPAPARRERLVVLAEGRAFASETEAPGSGPRRIIAAGGESTPAGQAVIIQTNVQGDQP